MGRWEKNTARWYEQTMVYSKLCGKIIPRRLWVVESGTETLVFCNRDCERLYEDYWLPSQQQS